ncbi:MAG: flavodoxin family protein [Desulfovibrio sp.]|nr:MAG: flavodoxin family protein [Desulfovibrio sp.]
MKVVAFNGSARKESNTGRLISEVFKELENRGVSTELVPLRGTKLSGCTACMQCFEKQDGYCTVKTDQLNEFVDKMRGADGIILGSPAYFGSVSTEMKALIDRAGLVAFANTGMLRHKAGASVVAARRIGFAHVLNQMNAFFSCFEMFTVGSNYPNMAVGEAPGDVEQDAMGLETMRVLGQNMAFLLGKLQG